MLLKRGSAGEEVKELQAKLTKLSFNTNGVDGIYGRGTEAAVKGFQNSASLAVDGMAGKETLTTIKTVLENQDPDEAAIGSTLTSGSKGTVVSNLQQRLNDLGLDVGSVDGIYGTGTMSAVKELQRAFGQSADGITGTKTWNLLTKLNPITNFTLSEFKCKHCGKLRLDINLLYKLEELRKVTGPLRINSGYRCATHNKNVGGATRSQHRDGTAADVRALNMSPSNVYAFANRIIGNAGGVGKYPTFTHVDVRGHRSRWGK